MSVKPKITEIIKHLNEGVYEKEESISLSLLAAISGESIFLLGAPGVAKSLIARKLKFAFKEAKSFEYLMNRFSTPDEIFGPYSISKMKDEDKLERMVTHYLPSANVVFLDEIWKASPSIQNALLTVLNEKIYRNGDQEIKLPMKALIAASNELPSKGEGLDALWDRFLIRINVESIKNQETFLKMIAAPSKPTINTLGDIIKISDDDYKLWNSEINAIEFPENIGNVIKMIRLYIEAYNQKKDPIENQLYISDRRWSKIVRLLKTSAFLNDRKAIDLMDCFLIKDCIWNEIEQKMMVEQFVREAIQKHGYSLKFDLKSFNKEIEDFEKEIIEETLFEKIISRDVLISDGDFYEITNFNKNFYIKIEDFNQLTTKVKNIYLYEKYNSNFSRYSTYNVKKNNRQNYIVIENDEFKLKTKSKEEKKTENKTPHEALVKYWNERIAVYISKIEWMKNQLEEYQNNDLKHLKVNLFVPPNLADIVQNQLIMTQNEIEKMTIEVKRIQTKYQKTETIAQVA